MHMLTRALTLCGDELLPHVLSAIIEHCLPLTLRLVVLVFEGPGAHPVAVRYGRCRDVDSVRAPLFFVPTFAFVGRACTQTQVLWVRNTGRRASAVVCVLAGRVRSSVVVSRLGSRPERAVPATSVPGGPGLGQVLA